MGNIPSANTDAESRNDGHQVRSGKGKPNKRSIGRRIALNHILQEWKKFDNEFITHLADYNALLLKVKNLSFNEAFDVKKVLVRKNIQLLLVNGYSKKFKRDRLLGYVVLYSGNPIVHSYTFFAGICFSPVQQIGLKEPRIIFDDVHARIFKLGVGTVDYFIGYRHRRKEHDQSGFGDGVVHEEMAKTWRDGF